MMQAHPDKGGDEATFKKIRSAYTKLSAYAIEEDLKANCPELEYEAVLKKVGVCVYTAQRQASAACLHARQLDTHIHTHTYTHM
jgi:hypothetical protein